MESPERDVQSHRRFFILGCVLETALLLLGAGLSAAFGLSFLGNLHWHAVDCLIASVAVLPPFLLFLWAIHSRWGPFRRIRRFLEDAVLPIFRRWTMPQLLLLSLLAGLGEEFFFRGAVQGGLTLGIGEVPAVIFASLLFGCFHPMTWGYLIFTSLFGLYLGGLWIGTDNLLAPIVTHALYDFMALVYLVKIQRPGSASG